MNKRKDEVMSDLSNITLEENDVSIKCGSLCVLFSEERAARMAGLFKNCVALAAVFLPGARWAGLALSSLGEGPRDQKVSSLFESQNLLCVPFPST